MQWGHLYVFSQWDVTSLLGISRHSIHTVLSWITYVQKIRDFVLIIKQSRVKEVKGKIAIIQARDDGGLDSIATERKANAYEWDNSHSESWVWWGFPTVGGGENRKYSETWKIWYTMRGVWDENQALYF